MRRQAGLAAGIIALSAGASAQDVPDYRDDRSDPTALVESLYNAIARKEYVRAWSYFDDDAAPEFASFAQGYADTAGVRLRTGEATGEGAAGSLYGAVPVVVAATAGDGTINVFTGCYETRQPQPAAQAEPPFRPIRIIAGELQPSDEDFETASGACPQKGL